MLVAANTEMVYAHSLCTLHVYTYECSTEQQLQLQCTLIHCLSCACRWFSWALTSSPHWCPACKIASRPRLAQVRGLCANVTIALPAPALAAGHKAVFSPGEHLGGSWWFSGSAEGQQGWCLHWQGECRGALPLLQFFLRELNVPVFFP